jgi:hypothetical protein
MPVLFRLPIPSAASHWHAGLYHCGERSSVAVLTLWPCSCDVCVIHTKQCCTLVAPSRRLRIETRLDRRMIAQPIGVEHGQVVARGNIQRSRGEYMVEAAANRFALTRPPPAAALHCITIAGAVDIDEVIGRQPGQDRSLRSILTAWSCSGRAFMCPWTFHDMTRMVLLTASATHPAPAQPQGLRQSLRIAPARPGDLAQSRSQAHPGRVGWRCPPRSCRAARKYPG